MSVVTARPIRPSTRLVGAGPWLGVLLALAGCGEGGSEEDGRVLRADDPSSAPGGGLNLDGANYPLVAGIGEIWGRGDESPTHFNIDFTLTDGRFAVTPILADGESAAVRTPVEASAILHAELYSAGATAFRFDDFDHVTEVGPGAMDADRNFFAAARVGVDADGSGEVELSEMRDIIGGNIAFEGPLPDISLTFDVVLEDGRTATGSYAGLFEFITFDPAP